MRCCMTRPISMRMSSSRRIVASAWAVAFGLHASTTIPPRPITESPSNPSMISRHEPTSVVTAGRPVAAASNKAIGCASLMLVKAITSARPRYSFTLGTRPRNCTVDSSPSWATSSRQPMA